MSKKLLLLVLLLSFTSLAAECDPEFLKGDPISPPANLAEMNKDIDAFVVGMWDRNPAETGLMKAEEWQPFVQQVVPLLRDAPPEEIVKFNRLLLQMFKWFERGDPAFARQFVAMVLRALLVEGNPPPPVPGAAWHQSARVEQPGDVRDYNLQQVIQNPSSARADINHVTAIGYNGSSAVGPLYPAGGRALPAPQDYLGQSSGWAMVGPWTGYVDFYLAQGQPYSLVGSAFFTYQDTVMVVEGNAWDITYNPDSSISLVSTGSAHIEYNEGLNTKGQGQLAIDFGNGFSSIQFTGFNAILDYDADGGTLDIVLIEGTVNLGAPVEAGFTVSSESPDALLLHVTADGGVEQQTLPIEPDTVQLFAAEMRSRTFVIDMVEPVATTSAEAEQVWYILLDLDGNPATGINANQNIMYTGLGADFFASVHLQPDGSVVAEGILPSTHVIIPVEAALSADRYTLAVSIPLVDLSQRVGEAGIAYAPENVRWRVAAITYDDENDPKDIFPELDFDYSQASEGASIENTPAGDVSGESPASCTATATDGANLRGGPSADFAQVGGVAGGDTLQVIGVNAAGNWYKLLVEGIDNAWIAAFLITPPVCPEGFTLPVVE
ncbi:MAG: SH3 domain-containing protein [Anaerolineae bacterium]|nr:SH3 domain-containing protein [Anaerolineae bacterium]